MSVGFHVNIQLIRFQIITDGLDIDRLPAKNKEKKKFKLLAIMIF